MKRRIIFASLLICMLFSVSVYAVQHLGPFVNDSDTLLLYHFDEGTGSVLADSSVYFRNGSMSADMIADPAKWISGQTGFGNAIDFNQEVSKSKTIDWSDSVNPIPLGNFSEFTIESWINPEGFAADEYIYSFGVTIGACVSVRWDKTLTANATSLTKLEVTTYSAGGWQDETVNLSIPLTAGQWQHFALVYHEINTTEATYEIYVNGQLSGSTTVNYQIGNQAGEVHIGHTPGGIWWKQYRGYFDEFRVSSIARDWTSAPQLPQTVGLYRFDTMFDDDDAEYGEYVADDSGNNLNLKRSPFLPYGFTALSLDVPSLAPVDTIVLDINAGTLEAPSTDLFSIGRNNELTIEFWYKPLAGNTIEYIVTQIDPGINRNSWDIYQSVPTDSNFAIAFSAFDRNGVLRTVLTPKIFNKTTGWSHIAITITKGGMVTIYQNGIPLVQQGGFTDFDSVSYPIAIGSDDDGNFAGKFLMDDLRITDRALGAGTGNGNGELAWNVSLSNALTKKQRPANLAKQWLRTHPFMISSWGASPNTSAYTAAKFNSALNSPSGYQAIAGAGVDNHWLGSLLELNSEAIKAVHLGVNAPRFKGWMVRDEIPADSINGVADIALYIRKLDASNIIYAGLGSSNEVYIDNVINTIQPDALIHAWYQFVNPAVPAELGIDPMEGHYADLEICRRKSLEYDIPLFYYIQSNADHLEDGTPYRYLPSESQLRSDLFTKLAFGVKGFIYFVFEVSNGGPLVDDALYDSSTGTPSSLYAPAQVANSEVFNLGNSLRFLESTDICFIKGQPTNPTPAALTNWSAGAGGDTHIQGIQIVQQGTGKDGLIGFFKDDTGQKYFMLTNLYQGQALSASAATLDFNVTFDSSVNTVWRLRRDTGAVEAISIPGHVLSFSLPGGTGDLFKYDNGNFQISGCADSTHAYPIGDLTGDCTVNFEDFAQLAVQWLNSSCNMPYWCDGADIDLSGSITVGDLDELANNWLE